MRSDNNDFLWIAKAYFRKYLKEKWLPESNPQQCFTFCAGNTFFRSYSQKCHTTRRHVIHWVIAKIRIFYDSSKMKWNEESQDIKTQTVEQRPLSGHRPQTFYE